MKKSTFLNSVEFRKDVLKGITNLADIVGQTLGPGGRAILIEQDNGSVLATKDGVTVAKAYAANSPVERLVSQASIEASERTVRAVGDGTTTSLVLAAAITEAGQTWLQNNPSFSPQRLSRELKNTVENTIIPSIKALSKSIKSLDIDQAKKAIWHVAMVSANSDEDIANAVSEAVEMVGEDGMVICEEGTGGLKTSVSFQKGFPSGMGFRDLGGSASTAFINRKAYGDAVLSDSWIALYDGEIKDVETLQPMMERISMFQDSDGITLKRPVVVVAHGFSDQVLKVMSMNTRAQHFTIIPLITPRNGQENGRQAFLYDLAAYTDGQVFDSQGNPLTNASPASLGFVNEVKIGQSESVFIVEPNEEAIKERVDELKEQMNGASEFDKDKLRYRIGQLTGGVATILAAGATALEAKERRDRVVDAVSAVRSAMDMGVVPGGGATLFHISRSLTNAGSNQILKQALKRPFIQILINAGVAAHQEEAMYVGNGVGQEPGGDFFVHDALKRESVEFWESGIFDPAKVTISALQNALSVAQLLMTCGGAIALQLGDADNNVEALKGLMTAAQNGEL